MMPAKELGFTGEATIRFSFNQLVVFDDSEVAPGSIWTERHWMQGFARRETAVAFSTVLQAGEAQLAVFSGSPEHLDSYRRVIAVPLSVPSGKVRVEGPEEYPIDRCLELPPGNYLVTLAQNIDDHDLVKFELFFDGHGVSLESRIVVADSGIQQMDDLLETAEPA